MWPLQLYVHAVMYNYSSRNKRCFPWLYYQINTLYVIKKVGVQYGEVLHECVVFPKPKARHKSALPYCVAALS